MFRGFLFIGYIYKQQVLEKRMSILTTDNLSLSFGDFDLFWGITVNIANDSKIGLIGPNGVGKTSLMLIMAGINPPTSGKVHIARGRRIGYLRQEAMEAFSARSHSVYAEMLTVFADVQARQTYLNHLEAEMSNGNVSSALLEEYGEMQEAFEHAGGYDYELRIQQTLEGLGLSKKYWDTPLDHLSGGQKTRALLARLLLQKPDLLMLDEPTNHLDIEAVEWLEHKLAEWEGAVLIVSHDRYFLDHTVNVIWEMAPNGITSYSGNYSAYLLQREERWEYYERVFEEEKARLLKEVDFIQRNWVRASTHARALGMLKQVSRELAVVDKYGIMELRNGRKWSETGLSADRPLDVVEAIRKVNSIGKSGNRPPRIRPRLVAQQPSGNMVLHIDEAKIGYPKHPLFAVKDVELRRGECAALIGPNGSGKTTFLRVLFGQLSPLAGEVHLGASLKIGYFAQVNESLVSDRSVLDELIQHKAMHPGEARSLLAQYLFRGDDVFKPVSALSGGERARLALVLLSLEGANFLVLDEPTNHLDIQTQEALQEVLDNFNGTILMVSHDRYLIDCLATQIWELSNNRLNVFKGTYREYALRRPATGSAAKPVKILLRPRPLQRDNSIETKRRMQSLGMLEDRIRQQETIVLKLNRELQKAGEAQTYEAVHDLSWKVAKAQNTLDDLLAEWEKLAE